MAGGWRDSHRQAPANRQPAEFRRSRVTTR